MRAKKKYLPLYYEWMKTGEMAKGGLCWSVGNPVTDPAHSMSVIFTNKDLLLFSPCDGCHRGYWAFGEVDLYKYHVAFSFTPLRQTILLFMAAMNNEL